MKKIISFKTIKFLISTSILTLMFFSFYIDNNFITSLHEASLLWSFFILCIPAIHGKNTIGFLFNLFTGKSLLYSQVYMWVGAIALNVYTYFYKPGIYLKSAFTHLLLRIVSTPSPYWLIIFFCGFATLYSFFIGQEKFKTKKVTHYTINTFFTILGIFTLFYLSYNEFIILLNIRA